MTGRGKIKRAGAGGCAGPLVAPPFLEVGGWERRSGGRDQKGEMMSKICWP